MRPIGDQRFGGQYLGGHRAKSGLPRGWQRVNVGRAMTCAMACAGLMAVMPARAHLEIQAGRAPYLDGAGAIVGGTTSWGVVLPDPDGVGFRRVCEESYDPSPTGVAAATFSLQRADGALIIGGPLGTFVSHDAGCTLAPLTAPLGSRSTSSGVMAAGRVFVATSDPDEENGIFVTEDNGDTWTVALAPRPGVTFLHLAASDDGVRLVATGTLAAVPASPVVFVSADGGTSWVDVSSAYAAFEVVSAGDFDDDGETLLFGGTQLVEGQYRGHVLETGPPYDAPVVLGLFPALVSDVTGFAGVRYAVVPLRGEMYTARDRASGFALSHDLNPLTPAPPGPTDCVGRTSAGTTLYGCARQSIDSLGLFLSSDDGDVWTAAVGFRDVAYRLCPLGTVGASKCAAYVEYLCRDGEDNDFDGATDCADADCAPCDDDTGSAAPQDAGAALDAGGGEAVDDVERGTTTSSGCGATTGPSGLALVLAAVFGASIRRRGRGAGRCASVHKAEHNRPVGPGADACGMKRAVFSQGQCRPTHVDASSDSPRACSPPDA